MTKDNERFGHLLRGAYKAVAPSFVRLSPQELLPLVGGFKAPEGVIDFEDNGFGKVAELLERVIKVLKYSRSDEQPDPAFSKYLGAIDTFARIVQTGDADRLASIQGLEIPTQNLKDLIRGHGHLDNTITKLTDRSENHRMTAPVALLLAGFRRGLLQIAQDHASQIAYKNGVKPTAIDSLIRLLPAMPAPATGLEEYQARLSAARIALAGKNTPPTVLPGPTASES